MTTKSLFIGLPDYPPLPSEDALEAISHGTEFHCTQVKQDAVSYISKNKKNLKFIVLNGPDKEILEQFRLQNSDGISILTTDLSMEQYASRLEFQENTLLDHVVSTSSGQDWTLTGLRVTIQKEMQNDLFGIDKYLKPETIIFSKKVTHSDQRRELNHEVMNYAESLRLTSATSKLLYGITEELLMNAIYDAPTGVDGQSIYGDVKRTKSISLSDEESCELSYGCDGDTFALGVRDPFGSLKKDKFQSYVKKVIRRKEGNKIIDTKKGGAGLGLFKILYSSHALICNSLPGHATEVISLIDIHCQIRDFSRMARSLHFFVGTRPATTQPKVKK